ncbi:MAG: hypothetical protein DHS20C17_29890 [Cyclobacteriaceae bacterium]|nr:MAG: hypothetical protein DHS20C17_29890 [Cyclobacteriaceae bacterium]
MQIFWLGRNHYAIYDHSMVCNSFPNDAFAGWDGGDIPVEDDTCDFCAHSNHPEYGKA